LLAGHAAADGFQFEASILSGFYGTAHGLADKRRYFNSALLYFQDHGSG
jgi:hypothetical protein